MLTHYTITSVGIFSILFSTHFLRCSKRTKKQNSCWKTNIAEQYLTKLSPKKKRNTWYSCLLLSYKVPKGYSANSHGWEKKDIIPFSWYQFHFNLNSENAFERGLIMILPRSRQNCTQFGLRSLVYFCSFVLEI